MCLAASVRLPACETMWTQTLTPAVVCPLHAPDAFQFTNPADKTKLVDTCLGLWVNVLIKKLQRDAQVPPRLMRQVAASATPPRAASRC